MKPKTLEAICIHWIFPEALIPMPRTTSKVVMILLMKLTCKQ